MSAWMDPEIAGLRTILDRRQIELAFQPIVDYRARSIVGFEALARGPADGPLHLPAGLFAAADRLGRRCELELLCCEAAVAAFLSRQLPGLLFINLSPSCLVIRPDWLAAACARLAELGVAASRIVIELTENEKLSEVPGVQAAIATLRGQGFRVAIDDLGEGFSNLRMWSELRPEYVKIDRHFVEGIASDRVKRCFVQAMVDIAAISSAQIIAEGIETADDFACLRDLGVTCGQGYFIARPSAAPTMQLNGAVLSALEGRRLVLEQPVSGHRCAGDLVREVAPLLLGESNDAAITCFEGDPDLDVLPVVDFNHLPVGLINRHSLFDRFAKPFRRELFGRRACDLFMDRAPVMVDRSARLQDVAMLLATAPRHHLLDGFVITDDGRYVGIGSSHDLMATITEMQINAARYANPLTQLPGNVPINEHIDSMLHRSLDFVAAYIDIDNFKPFNDTFGYRRGDEVISLLGRVLLDAVDPAQDFVGHIGGDDFFVVFQSSDWEYRCWQVVHTFRQGVDALLNLEEEACGGYLAENRQGEMRLQPPPTLSIGAVRIPPGHCESHREVAAMASVAKKQAKKAVKHADGQRPLGSLFVERRRPAVNDLPAPRVLN